MLRLYWIASGLALFSSERRTAPCGNWAGDLPVFLRRRRLRSGSSNAVLQRDSNRLHKSLSKVKGKAVENFTVYVYTDYRVLFFIRSGGAAHAAIYNAAL